MRFVALVVLVSVLKIRVDGKRWRDSAVGKTWTTPIKNVSWNENGQRPNLSNSASSGDDEKYKTRCNCSSIVNWTHSLTTTSGNDRKVLNLVNTNSSSGRISRGVADYPNGPWVCQCQNPILPYVPMRDFPPPPPPPPPGHWEPSDSLPMNYIQYRFRCTITPKCLDIPCSSTKKLKLWTYNYCFPSSTTVTTTPVCTTSTRCPTTTASNCVVRKSTRRRPTACLTTTCATTTTPCATTTTPCATSTTLSATSTTSCATSTTSCATTTTPCATTTTPCVTTTTPCATTTTPCATTTTSACLTTTSCGTTTTSCGTTTTSCGTTTTSCGTTKTPCTTITPCLTTTTPCPTLTPTCLTIKLTLCETIPPRMTSTISADSMGAMGATAPTPIWVCGQIYRFAPMGHGPYCFSPPWLNSKVGAYDVNRNVL